MAAVQTLSTMDGTLEICYSLFFVLEVSLPSMCTPFSVLMMSRADVQLGRSSSALLQLVSS